MGVAIIILSGIALIGFVFYDRSGAIHRETMRKVIDEQNRVILSQQKVIDELYDKVGD